LRATGIAATLIARKRAPAWIAMVTADAIDQLLPQTQCTKCGYQGCRPYAEAIAAGDAEINRCPPGGAEGIELLAVLLGREPKALDPDCGIEREPTVALVIESECIGCTKCIAACPVDAIVGASKLMHAVLSDECTGCELCLAPCPVDCIVMVPIARVARDPARSAHSRRRYLARNARLAREAAERVERLAAHAAAPPADGEPDDAIAAALRRAEAKRKRLAGLS
jgi:electron transport complex protein RnfB